MARRHRPRIYKQVLADTVDFGGSGDQVLLATISPIDVQAGPGWLKNVVISVLQNDGDGDNGGFMFYLSTSNSWNDDYVIAARATPGGLSGNVSLSARRYIRDNVADVSRNDAELYVWGEVTDLGTTQNTARVIVEAWGRFISMA